jgi:hypothetical protein
MIEHQGFQSRKRMISMEQNIAIHNDHMITWSHDHMITWYQVQQCWSKCWKQETKNKWLKCR